MPANGVWTVLCSVIASHSQEYAVACFSRAMKVAGGVQAMGSSIHLYCDCGPHFRAYKFMATVGLGLHESAKKNVVQTFGCEHHFKNPSDQLFGRMDEWFAA